MHLLKGLAVVLHEKNLDKIVSIIQAMRNQQLSILANDAFKIGKVIQCSKSTEAFECARELDMHTTEFGVEIGATQIDVPENVVDGYEDFVNTVYLKLSENKILGYVILNIRLLLEKYGVHIINVTRIDIVESLL